MSNTTAINSVQVSKYPSRKPTGSNDISNILSLLENNCSQYVRDAMCELGIKDGLTKAQLLDIGIIADRKALQYTIRAGVLFMAAEVALKDGVKAHPELAVILLLESGIDPTLSAKELFDLGVEPFKKSEAFEFIAELLCRGHYEE